MSSDSIDSRSKLSLFVPFVGGKFLYVILISSEDVLLAGVLPFRSGPFFTVNWAASEESEKILVLLTTISGEVLSSCISKWPSWVRISLGFRRFATADTLVTESFLPQIISCIGREERKGAPTFDQRTPTV